MYNITDRLDNKWIKQQTNQITNGSPYWLSKKIKIIKKL